MALGYLFTSFSDIKLGVGGGSLRLGREKNLQNCTKVSAGYTASHAKLLVVIGRHLSVSYLPI
jgi:hypothetical protein